MRSIAEAHRATGGALYLVTLTLPHDQGDRLAPLYQAVADSYRYVRSGAPWYAMKERIGYIGEIRALEATVGRNGWHPHLHVLLFTTRALDGERLAELHGYLHRRWSQRVERFGYRVPSEEHGVTIVESRRDDYLAKMGLADELVRGVGKSAHGEARAPFQVLADFAETGDTADLALWREWTEAMHGARQLTWSRDLRKRYAAEPEKTDAEVVAGETDGEEESVMVLPSGTWRALVLSNPDAPWLLLDAAESGGAEAVDALIAVLSRVGQQAHPPSALTPSVARHP